MLITELIKLKNTAIIWCIILGCVFIPSAVFVNILTEALSNTLVHQEWTFGWKRVLIGSSFFTAPMVMVLIPCFVMDIEYRSNTWKYLLTLPISKQSLFNSKLLISILICFLFYICSFLAFTLLWSLYGIIFPSSELFNSEFHIPTIVILSIRMIISSIAILTLHFWLSLYVKNIIYNIGLGVVGIVFGILTFDWHAGFYFPYSACLVSVLKVSNDDPLLIKNEFGSIFLIAISYISSYWYFVKKFNG